MAVDCKQKCDKKLGPITVRNIKATSVKTIRLKSIVTIVYFPR